jgi:hypothetical protein
MTLSYARCVPRRNGRKTADTTKNASETLNFSVKAAKQASESSAMDNAWGKEMNHFNTGRRRAACTDSVSGPTAVFDVQLRVVAEQ